MNENDPYRFEDEEHYTGAPPYLSLLGFRCELRSRSPVEVKT